jgi:hypothetical protein
MSSIYARDARVCAFCEMDINTSDTNNNNNNNSDKSICEDCSRKYKINTYNFDEEGCGCDG